MKYQIGKRMLSFLLIGVLVLTTVFGSVIAMPTKEVKAAETPQYRNVMYYGNWSIYAGQNYFNPDEIDGSLITHLNFAFMDVDENGNLISTDKFADYQKADVGYGDRGIAYEAPYAGVLGAMLLLREEYPNMKIGISVGGWTRSGDFPTMAANPVSRKNFAENVAKFVHYYGYDFVDIDWEYPTAYREPDPASNGVNVDKGCKGSPEDTENFTLMLQAIRDELDKYGEQDGKYYELSVAMSANPSYMEKIEYDKVLKIVDFANMMTYDLNGAWADYTAHQTALYTNDAYNPDTQTDAAFSVDSCVKYLEQEYGDNIDYSKIVIGVAPYTRGWAGVEKNWPDDATPGLYASAKPNSVTSSDGTTSGTYAYSDIGKLITQYQLKEYWDEEAKAAYYYSEETGYFFTCDNEKSVEEKGKYVKEKGLGGLISWMASLDASSTVTKAMKESLYGDAELPTQEIVIPAARGFDVQVTASKDTYTFTITNNNTLTESGDAILSNASAEANILPVAEKFAKTAINPTFYIKTANNDTLTGQINGTVTQENGYTVVSVTSYDAKTFEPGETITITLKAESGNADVNNITSVAMTQKATETSSEEGISVLFGEGTPEDIPVVDDSNEDKGNDMDDGANDEVNVDDETNDNTDNENGENEDQTPTGTYPAWAVGVDYKVGDLVSYNDKVYQCIIAHTSQSTIGWRPEDLQIWGLTDLVNTPSDSGNADGESGDDSGNGDDFGNGADEENGDTYYVNSKLPQHMVTGYWHNFINGSANLKLSDIPEYYDLICVAFTGNTATQGEVTFELDKDLCTALGGYTKEEFIQDIKDLQANGQEVIISVGGAEGRIEINDADDAALFAEGLIDIIEEYGFDGVDIDLEGSAVAGVDYIASSLRTVYNHFNDKDFIITMAPETYYIQADRLSSNDITTAYLRLAIEIQDILTICYPQFYNSGGMNGYNGSVVNQGNADFLTSLSTLVIETGGLRPDQVAMGVPSTSQAATSGYVSNDVIETAFNAMINGTSSGGFTVPKAYPTFRGVMTWSINWDATNDYARAKAMSALMDDTPEVDNGSTDPEEDGNGTGGSGSGDEAGGNGTGSSGGNGTGEETDGSGTGSSGENGTGEETDGSGTGSSGGNGTGEETDGSGTGSSGGNGTGEETDGNDTDSSGGNGTGEETDGNDTDSSGGNGTGEETDGSGTGSSGGNGTGDEADGSGSAEYEENSAVSVIGKTFKYGKFRYKVKSSTAVTLLKPVSKNKTTAKIPATVKYQNKKYKVTAISKKAFKNNKKLKRVTIGKNVKTIGKNAFAGCKKLQSVTIGAQVTKIESKAFYNCKKLSKVTFKGKKLEKVGSKAFAKTNKNLKIKVKDKSTIKKYKKILKGKIPVTTKIVKK